MPSRLFVVLLVTTAGCGGSGASRDAADGLASPGDALAPVDLGGPGRADTGSADLGPTDAGPDLGAPDARPADATPGVDAGEAPPAACAGDYAAPMTTGALADPELTEVSGIAASLTSPGVLWMHNDSGDGARLFATGTDGRALGRLRLDGVDAEDFEDLAAAPCPDGRGACLWVADTGTNNDGREEVAVYVVPEPEVDADRPFGEQTSAPVHHLPFRYPGDEVVDVEALAVAADGSTFYVIEKVDGPRARVWRHPGPLEHGRAVTLEPVATLSSPGFAIPKGRMVTAADLHRSGRRLLVRVYTGTYEYRLGEGQDLGDLGEVAPRTVAVGPLSEPQGEAAAYDAEGTGVWTVSEDPALRPGQPLHHYRCRP